jgi:hypothetical protein
MKRVILICTLLLAAAATRPAGATEVGTSRTFGLGVQLVDPTAIIGKVFLGHHDAFDFGLGFWGYGRCYDDNGTHYCSHSPHDFSLHADYLYEETIVQSRVRLDWHAGLGARLIFWGYTYDNADHGVAVLARVPLGLDLTFQRPSWLEVYLEIAPALVVIPPLDFTFDVGLGARAYF